MELRLEVPSEELRELVREFVSDELERRISSNRVARWATLEEAAEHLRTTPAALRKRAQRCTLAGAVKDGGRWLVDLRELDSDLARD